MIVTCRKCKLNIYDVESYVLDHVRNGRYCKNCFSEEITKQLEKEKENIDEMQKLFHGVAPTGSVKDPIKPSHYHHGGLDVFTIMDKNMPHQLEGFFVGNVLKYVMRYEYKNGLEDLKKAKEYLEKLIELKS